MPKTISALKPSVSISVILPRWDEPTVIQLTRENLQRELAAISGSELIVADNWVAGIRQSKGDFICLVEPDCLVSSGYFSSNLNLFKKNTHYRKLAIVSSCIGLNNWGNRIYGYRLEKVTYGKDEATEVKQWEIQPQREKKSTSLFPVQVGYLPGAIVRRSAMEAIVEKFSLAPNDLVKLSTDVSFFFWDTGRRINVNPNTTYVSTQHYLENPPQFKWNLNGAHNIFEKELI